MTKKLHDCIIPYYHIKAHQCTVNGSRKCHFLCCTLTENALQQKPTIQSEQNRIIQIKVSNKFNTFIQINENVSNKVNTFIHINENGSNKFNTFIHINENVINKCNTFMHINENVSNKFNTFIHINENFSNKFNTFE